MPTWMHAPATQEDDGLHRIAGAVYGYLRELHEYRDTCMRHEKTAAIHDTESDALEVYRMFDRKRETAEQLHRSLKMLPNWQESPYWVENGQRWEELKSDIGSRVDRHTKQYHIALQGVVWENIPMLVHAYKFDGDPKMKIEIVIPAFNSPFPILPLRLVAEALRLHEFLIPEHIAKPCPPFAGHEARFLTVWEYLSTSMPRSLYASRCLPTPPGET
ncbi:hypothetical protein HYZ99_04680 [Candidatus Peregrinibacteria bacterium]|nr:hypothetical protein [Candidatus Peregrinibacteria bacterium]